jgi:hypothetical protein
MINEIVRIEVKPMEPRTRVLLLAIRQALLIALGAIEEYLGCDRSVKPKHLRN